MKNETRDSIEFLFLIIGVPVLVLGGGIIGLDYLIGEVVLGGEEGSEKRMDRNELRRAEIAEIKKEINDGNLSCEYVGELRIKYAGDGFINALDDNWVNSKVRAYWNVSNCGAEWNWWD